MDFLVATRYYTDLPEELPPKDLDGDGVAGRKDYLIFAREFAGVGEDYLPDLFAIDDLLAFADVSGDGEVGATDYLIAYATLYEKEISECLTNGISRKTSITQGTVLCVNPLAPFFSMPSGITTKFLGVNRDV